jgi:hypothetical protein
MDRPPGPRNQKTEEWVKDDRLFPVAPTKPDLALDHGVRL